MAIRVERQVGPTGVHYEARILRDPKNPETSDWEALADREGSEAAQITADSFGECALRAGIAGEEQGIEAYHVVVARVETTYIFPTDNDLGQEMMQVNRIPKGRRFRLEDEPGKTYLRVDLPAINCIEEGTGRFLHVDSLQFASLLPTESA
jgi:hypothetical protein